MSGPFFTFGCESTYDPAGKSRSPLSSFCPSVNLDQTIVFYSGAQETELKIAGDLYGGLYFYDLFSLHWKSFFNAKKELSVSENTKVFKKTDYLLAQVGNHSVHRWSLKGGLMHPAFGLGDAGEDSYNLPFDLKITRPEAQQGFGFSFDNLTSVSLELTVHQNWFPGKKSETDPSLSFRCINDISNWSGTRIVFSLLGKNNGQRAYGFGALNIAPDGGSSLFEWQRFLKDEEGNQADFQQKLELFVKSGRRHNRQTYLHYNDIRFESRLIVIGQKFHIFTHGYINCGIGFKKDETPARQHLWFFSGGIRVHV